MTTVRVRVVEDEAALAALAPAWWALWRDGPDASPFRSPAWLLPWWDVFRPGRLASLAAFDGDRLAGLAPFYLESGAFGTRLLPLGIGISDDLDLLVAPGERARVLPALAEAAAALRGWTRWELEEAPPGAAALALPAREGWRVEEAEQSVCPVLALPPGGDALAAVPARQRRKLRMAENRAGRRGCAIEPVGPDGVPAFLADLFRLHSARWESRGEGGVLAHEDVRRFHALALPALAEAGLAQLFRARIGGAVAGAYYGLVRPGHAYAYLGGFDPAFAFESPGTLLLGHAIAEAGRAGAGSFHLLRGQEAYKYAWGAVDRPNRRRTLLRPETAA